MVYVGVATATSAWFLASATDALATLDLIAAAASARLALEKTQNATPKLMGAWRKWYGEALETVRRLSVNGPSAAVDRAVTSAR